MSRRKCAWLTFAAIALFASRSESASVPYEPGKGKWDVASLPADVRSRIHTTARDVPAFPNEEPKLMHLKNWPTNRVIDGRKCVLGVGKLIVDFKAPPTRPEYGKQISARYSCKPRWWWGKTEPLGPGYVWTSDGQLLERAYHRSGRRMVTIYQYDRAGRLVGYLDGEHGTEEYFEVDGSLIAGEYGPVHNWLGKRVSYKEYVKRCVSLWLGERVSHQEYMERRIKLFREMRWRY